MKVAIVGSRNLVVSNLGDYLPDGVTEIVSGGARGIDACAREYAISHGLKLTEFLPEYEKYGKAAPLKRNEQIAAYADEIVAFWDGKSRGTKNVIEVGRSSGTQEKVYIIQEDGHAEKKRWNKSWNHGPVQGDL